jgi:hypothetical protein
MAFDYSMAEKVRQERAAKLLAEEEVGCAIHTTAMASTSSNSYVNLHACHVVSLFMLPGRRGILN